MNRIAKIVIDIIAVVILLSPTIFFYSHTKKLNALIQEQENTISSLLYVDSLAKETLHYNDSIKAFIYITENGKTLTYEDLEHKLQQKDSIITDQLNTISYQKSVIQLSKKIYNYTDRKVYKNDSTYVVEVSGDRIRALN